MGQEPLGVRERAKNSFEKKFEKVEEE